MEDSLALSDTDSNSHSHNKRSIMSMMSSYSLYSGPSMLSMDSMDDVETGKHKPPNRRDSPIEAMMHHVVDSDDEDPASTSLPNQELSRSDSSGILPLDHERIYTGAVGGNDGFNLDIGYCYLVHNANGDNAEGRLRVPPSFLSRASSIGGLGDSFENQVVCHLVHLCQVGVLQLLVQFHSMLIRSLQITLILETT